VDVGNSLSAHQTSGVIHVVRCPEFVFFTKSERPFPLCAKLAGKLGGRCSYFAEASSHASAFAQIINSKSSRIRTHTHTRTRIRTHAHANLIFVTFVSLCLKILCLLLLRITLPRVQLLKYGSAKK
jgi:hypothetical protein